MIDVEQRKAAAKLRLTNALGTIRKAQTELSVARSLVGGVIGAALDYDELRVLEMDLECIYRGIQERLHEDVDLDEMAASELEKTL